jgi:hypothetical protein
MSQVEKKCDLLYVEFLNGSLREAETDTNRSRRIILFDKLQFFINADYIAWNEKIIIELERMWKEADVS